MRRRHAFLVATLFFGACDSGRDDSDDILVFVHDAPQCEQPFSLASSTQSLVEAGIDVLESWCGIQNGSYCAACGCPSGFIFVHKIRSVNLTDAGRAGYQPIEPQSYQREVCRAP
jgi:hypothetical protein